jgi:hypothetical protein
MPEWVAILIGVSLWCVWWLFAVDWAKAWPVLSWGGWAPVVLLVVVSAYAWSQIAPGDCGCLRFVRIPSGWWHLGSTAGLALLALFCGWLQAVLHCAPAEVAIEPPGHGSAAHGHGHGHH